MHLHLSLRSYRVPKRPLLAQPNTAQVDTDLLSLQFTPQELQAFLEAYMGQVDSVHEDTEVSISEMERPAPWGLDRLDQTALPLNGEFDYYNLGTGVNVYIVDTVSRRGFPGFCFKYVPWLGRLSHPVLFQDTDWG